MKNTSSTFERFLDRVHRRWIFVRAIERMGLSLVVACAIATVLSVILISRGEAAMGAISFCLALGLLCGILIGLLTRPTLFETAVEVDRQLNLSDLLATALAVSRSNSVVTDDLDNQW